MSRDRIAGAPVISEATEEALSERQLVDYREHKHGLLRWLSRMGKDPDRVEGYSDSTIEQATYQIGVFYRWVWDREGYTTAVVPEQADEYMRDGPTATRRTGTSRR